MWISKIGKRKTNVEKDLEVWITDNLSPDKYISAAEKYENGY